MKSPHKSQKELLLKPGKAIKKSTTRKIARS